LERLIIVCALSEVLAKVANPANLHFHVSSKIPSFSFFFFYLFSSSSWIALAVILEIGEMECKSRWGT
jgi:hypothetical protein